MTLWWLHFAAALTILVSGIRFIPFLQYLISLVGFYLIVSQTAVLLAFYSRTKLSGRGVLPTTSKAVLITGCATGFGHDLAKRLDKLGFYVFATCRTLNCEGAKKLRSECSRNVQVLQLDVTNEDDVKRALKDVTTSLIDKELWAIVNNAGISCTSEVEWNSLSLYKKALDVNFLGTVRVTQAFLPLLRESEGRIVNVTSALGRTGAMGGSAYCSSKGACVMFTECLRQEMRRWGVKVCAIEPWFYETPMTNEENLLAVAFENWANLSNEVKDAYGSSYFDQFVDLHKKVLKEHVRSQSYEVLDCVEDAITSKDPNETYAPRDFLARIKLAIHDNLPEPLKDLYMERSSGYDKLVPNMVAKRRRKTLSNGQVSEAGNERKAYLKSS